MTSWGARCLLAVDKKSRIPVYVQVMDSIISQIEDGILNTEMKLPSERELCDLYDVSRATIRQAVKELEIDGFVQTFKGRGSFVASRRFNQDMSSLYGFTESMKELGKTISTKLIEFDQIECDERVARKMKCAVGTMIYRFKRVRYADKEPMLLVTTHLPCSRFPDFDSQRLITESMYAMMSNTYNVTFTSAKETLQSVTVRKDERALLQVGSNASCMKIDRYTYERDELIEYAIGIARGDKFEYNVTLR